MVGCQTPQSARRDLAPRHPSSSGASGPLHAFKVFPIYSTERRVTPITRLVYMGTAISRCRAPMGRRQRRPLACVLNIRPRVQRMGGDLLAGSANNGECSGRGRVRFARSDAPTFWARAGNGGERVHELKMGGFLERTDFPFGDCNIRLTRNGRIRIDLSKADLRHIIGVSVSLC